VPRSQHRSAEGDHVGIRRFQLGQGAWHTPARLTGNTSRLRHASGRMAAQQQGPEAGATSHRAPSRSGWRKRRRPQLRRPQRQRQEQQRRQGQGRQPRPGRRQQRSSCRLAGSQRPARSETQQSPQKFRQMPPAGTRISHSAFPGRWHDPRRAGSAREALQAPGCTERIAGRLGAGVEAEHASWVVLEVSRSGCKRQPPWPGPPIVRATF